MKSTKLVFLILISYSLTIINLSIAKQNYIMKCCQTTSYPKLCYSTLSPYTTVIKTDAKTLATKALTVALKEAHSASKAMLQLSKHPGLKPKETSALSDCNMALGSSVAHLQRSIQEMGRRSTSQAQREVQASDVQTWTSTALTYVGTCMEGFSENDMNGDIKLIVRRDINRLTQLTSIALALVCHSYGGGIKAHHGDTSHP